MYFNNVFEALLDKNVQRFLHSPMPRMVRFIEGFVEQRVAAIACDYNFNLLQN